MKRHTFTVAALLAALSVSAAPKAKWLANSHDFGVINEADGLASCTFSVVNTGNEPLLITGARANCGCTTPRYPHSPIAPGDTAVISVAYDPAGRPGRFHKKIYVDTNAQPQRGVLEISGSVVATEATLNSHYRYKLGNLRVKDRFILFGDVAPNDSRGNYVEAYNATSDTIRPVFDASKAPHLTVHAQPSEVPPGEQFIYSVVLRADKRGLWGRYNESFDIVNGPDTLTVETTFNVVEDFSGLSSQQIADAPRIATGTDRLSLGQITFEQGKPIVKQLKIENHGNSTLRLRRIYSPDPAVSATSKTMEIKKGKSATVDIVIDPDLLSDPEMLNTTLDIISNDPTRPVLTLRLVAEFI